MSQILERADETLTSYKRIAMLSGITATYIDNLSNQFGTYYYRLKASSYVSESAYSNCGCTQIRSQPAEC